MLRVKTTMELHENRQPKRKASVRTQMGDDDGDHSPPRKKQHQQPLPAASNININGGSSEIDLDFFKKMPPGYRFCPSDEELIVCYLKKKVMMEDLPRNKIVHVNIYMHNPDYLSERYEHYGENEWYFFTSRERKHLNGTRPNRATPDGYWKASGADQPIKFQADIVGYKRALVFYKGKPKQGYKTNWLMQEYTLNTPPPISSSGANSMRLNDWVLCKIYKNYNKSTKTQPVGFSDNQLTFETGVNETCSTKSDHRDVVVDSAGYIHQPYIQQPLQYGHLDVPQINDPSHANFVNLEDQFHVQDAAAISYRNNYETQPQMVEPVGIIPPFIHQMENSMGPNYIPEEYNLMGFQENSLGFTNLDNCYLQWQDSFNWDYHDSEWNFEVDLANNEPENPPN